jgi:hypothetical protein
MRILERARKEFLELCEERGLDLSCPVIVRPLSPDEAIGPTADPGFVIKQGKDRVIEAVFESARGQAFTDAPSEWVGTLRDMLSLDLSDDRRRAAFVATMNAVLRSLGAAAGTVHCLDEEPMNCGQEMARQLQARFGQKRLGLIGLQPAILRALAEHLGAESVRAVDLNPDNVGAVRFGVQIWDGETDLPRLVEWCEVGLATGSSIVNGTIDGIVRLFAEAGKPLVFFGNTISGAAALLSLDRICPFGR